MKNIISAWRSSFELFAPKTIVPILQVTVKTLLEVYWLIITQLWWFFALGVFIFFAKLQPVFYITWLVLWCTFLIIFARPSVEQKDFWYFAHRTPYGFFVMCIFFVSWYLWYIHSMIVILLLPYYCFCMFFLTDSNYVIADMLRAPLRAAKLSIAYAPLSLLISTALGLTAYFLLTSLFLKGIHLFVMAPFFVVLLSRLYVMGIHKGYKEYYERCW